MQPYILREHSPGWLSIIVEELIVGVNCVWVVLIWVCNLILSLVVVVGCTVEVWVRYQAAILNLLCRPISYLRYLCLLLIYVILAT